MALQVERERRVKEKRERRMMERQLSRRQEYVRRCRLIIEERRRKVQHLPCMSLPFIRQSACAPLEAPTQFNRSVPRTIAS